MWLLSCMLLIRWRWVRSVRGSKDPREQGSEVPRGQESKGRRFQGYQGSTRGARVQESEAPSRQRSKGPRFQGYQCSGARGFKCSGVGVSKSSNLMKSASSTNVPRLRAPTCRPQPFVPELSESLFHCFAHGRPTQLGRSCG